MGAFDHLIPRGQQAAPSGAGSGAFDHLIPGRGAPPASPEAGAAVAADDPFTPMDVPNQFARGAFNDGVMATGRGLATMAQGALHAIPERYRDAAVTSLAGAMPLAGAGLAIGMGDGRSPARVADDFLTGYRDEATSWQRAADKALPVSESFQRSLAGDVTRGFGQLVPTIATGGMGKAASAVAALGQTYDEGFQEALAENGGDEEDAHFKALKYLPSAALDYVGDRFIVGKVFKPLTGRISVGKLAARIAGGALVEGATEGAQQAWLNAVLGKLSQFDPSRMLDDEIIRSFVVGGIVGGGASTAIDGTRNLLAKPEAQPPPLPDQGAQPPPLPGKEAPFAGVSVEQPAATASGQMFDDTLVAAPRVEPARQPGPVAAPAPASVSVGETGRAESAPVEQPVPLVGAAPATPPDPEEAANRAAEEAYRREQEAELEAVRNEGTIGLQEAIRRAGGLPNGKHRAAKGTFKGELKTIRESMTAARKAKIVTDKNLEREDAPELDVLREALNENGFDFATPGDVLATVQDWLTTGREPRAMMPNAGGDAQGVDTPFSQQPGPTPAPDVPLLRKAASAMVRGWQAKPAVAWYASVDELPDSDAGRQARASAARGNAVEGFWLGGKVHLIAAGIARVAASRGIAPEERAQQVMLHEVVGHGGVGALLDAQSRRAYNNLVSDVIARLPQAEREALAKSYEWDMDRADHRARLAEEWLARQTEGGKPAQGFAAKIIAKLRVLLRKIAPNLKWTDGDIAELLAAGRRNAEKGKVRGGAEARQSYVGEKSQMSKLMRDSLETAKAMAGAGRTSDEIRAVTGWFPGIGKDTKLRFEVPDEGAKLNPSLASLKEGAHPPSKIVAVDYYRANGLWNVTLSPEKAQRTTDLIQLKAVTAPVVRAMVSDDVWQKMQQNAGEDSLSGDLETHSKLIRTDYQFDGFNALPLEDVLEHPLLFAAYPEAKDIMVRVNPKMHRGGSFSVMDTGEKVITVGRAEQLSTLLHEIQHWIQNKEGFARGSSPSSLMIYPETREALRQAIAKVPDDISVADGKQIEKDIYRRTAGEIESRDVQARQRFTPEQRKAIEPYSSENIAPEDAIVLFGSSADEQTSNTDDIRFSQQTAEQERGFIRTVKENESLPERLRSMIEGAYVPFTDAAAIETARAQVNMEGVAAGMTRLAGVTSWTAQDVATAHELLQRTAHDESGATVAAQVAMIESLARNLTSYGQAVQKAHLFSKLSAAGAELYIRRQTQKAIAEHGAGPELADALAQIERLNGELAQARATTAGNVAAEQSNELRAELNSRDAIIARMEKALAELQREASSAEREAKTERVRGQLDSLNPAEYDGLTSAVFETVPVQVREALSEEYGLDFAESADRSTAAEIWLAENLGGTGARPSWMDRAVSWVRSMLRKVYPKLQWTDREIRVFLTAKHGAGQPQFSQQDDPAARIGELERELGRMRGDKARADEAAKKGTAASARLAEVQAERDRLRAALDRLRKSRADLPPEELRQILEQFKLPEAEVTRVNQKIRDNLIAAATGYASSESRIRGALRAAGLSEKQAEKLTSRAVKAMKAQAQKVRGKLIQDLLNEAVRISKTGTSKQQRATPGRSDFEKLQRLNESGALDDPKLFAAIAGRLGVPVFTSETRAELRRLQAAYEGAKPGNLKLAAAAKMLDFIYGQVPPSLWTKTAALWSIVKIFSWKTIVRNVMGNGGLWLMKMPADTLALAFDKGVSVLNGKRTLLAPAYAARFRGLAAPWGDLKEAWADSKERFPAAGPLRWTQDAVAHGLTLWRLASRGIAAEADLRRASASVFSSRTMKLVEAGITATQGSADRAFFQSAYQAEMENQMAVVERATGQRPALPTEEMLRRATIAGQRATFQEKNWVSTGLKKMQEALNLIPVLGGKKFGVGNIELPFVQVPGGMIREGIRWTPLEAGTFARALYDLALGKGDVDQRELVEAAGKMFTGSSLLGLGLWLASMGVLTAAGDDDDEINALEQAAGLGKYRINLSELYRRLLSGNFRPATPLEALQTGDKIVPFDWLQPAATPLAAGAHTLETMRARGTAQAHGKVVGSSELVLPAVNAVFGTVFQTPMLSSLQRLFDAAKRDGAGGAAQQVAGEAITGWVPAILRQTANVFDNELRETRGGAVLERTMNEVLSAVPGASGYLPKKFNVLGDEAQRYGEGPFYARLWNAMLSPTTIKEATANPVAVEALRLYRDGASREVLPHSLASSRKITLGGQQRELTNEEIALYNKYAGRLQGVLLAGWMATPGYVNGSDAAKARVFAQTISAVHSAAKFEIFGYTPKDGLDDRAKAVMLFGRKIKAGE